MIEHVEVDELTGALWKDTKNGIYIAPERRRLASGIMSCFYANIGDVVISHPHIKKMVVNALVETFIKKGPLVNMIIGVPEGMTNLTSSVGDKIGLGQLRVRENKTDHGDQRSIEGEYEEGMAVGIFEDVLSTGISTINRAVKPLREANLVPASVTALIDRQYSGLSKLRFGQHIPTSAFINTRGFVESLLRQDLPSLSQIKLLQIELSELTAK